MIRRLLWRLLIFLEGGEGMLAYFLANQIVMGKLEFSKVPAVFKEQVREILIDSGAGELTE